MQEEQHDKYVNAFDNEIDLRELFNVLLQGKWEILP